MIDHLADWGWSEDWARAYQAEDPDSHLNCPGRILSQRENTFTVATADGLVWAHPAGILFHRYTTLNASTKLLYHPVIPPRYTTVIPPLFHLRLRRAVWHRL